MARKGTLSKIVRNALPLFAAVVMVVSIGVLLTPIFFGSGSRERPADGVSGELRVAEKEKPAAVVAEVAVDKKPSGAVALVAKQSGVVNAEAVAVVVDATEAAQERAIERWEGLVDAAEELTEAPGVEMAETFKKAFDAMTLENKEDNIDYALHLLPDSQFAVLYLILFNKNEDYDILDSILCDALNREESIKMPLLRELRKDKEHPLWEEVDRILEVIDDD
ncbi:MAG: hypothetical protein GX230_06415 [Lentisphaerae bacterium]|jgi:hypothetical protein|nr:hypothetical protein [Lentisphaerota bacterium]